MKIRCYSELIQLPTMKDRYEYLKLSNRVGEETFGYDRVFNQNFYSSDIWRRVRREVIIRDNACDLAMPGHEIDNHVTIHHMNPVTREDIKNEEWEKLTDPEYLICVSYRTHQAIHYGDSSLLPQLPIERRPGDTCPWR